jgi:uncharacterized protein
MTTVDDTLHSAWTSWRTRRDETLRAPHGWLSVTALYWLGAEPTEYELLPGRWSAVAGQGVYLHATVADRLERDGAPLVGDVHLLPGEGAAGIVVTFADKQIEVIQRTGYHALRLRDPQAPTRTGFTGVPTYPVDARWVIQATFEPYDAPQRVTGGAVVAKLRHHHTARGLLRFTVDGVEHTLLAFDGDSGRLSVLFRDATSGVTTPNVRSVTVDAIDGAGPVLLDLNRVENLPCGFTDFATCPLPPSQNVLPFEVRAGERALPREGGPQ